jgi:hypothetical protein
MVRPPCLAIARTIWSEWTRADGPLWVAFGHCSCSLASLPDYHENHLIWVGSIMIVPLGLFEVYTLTSPWASCAGQSLLISYCTLFTFCSCDDCEFCHNVFLFHYCLNISLLCFWSWKCISGISIPHLTSILRVFNKNHISQDPRLLPFLYRVLLRLITSTVSREIYETNFSNGVKEGEAVCSLFVSHKLEGVFLKKNLCVMMQFQE